MDWQTLIPLLSNLPFAVFVAAFMLFRLEKVLLKLATNEEVELEILRRMEFQMFGRNYPIGHKTEV